MAQNQIGIDLAIEEEDKRLPAIFLAWSPPSHTRRSELIARKLGIHLERVYVLKMKRFLAPVRYVAQAVLTVTYLLKRRPRVILVQNPPIFASLFAWLYCLFSGAGLVIDSHTDAIQSRVWKWSLGLHRFLSRRALTTMVTNSHLADIIRNWGARASVVPDVPSQFPAGQTYPVGKPFNVVMVSSFATDEPLDRVIKVAESLPDVGFYVTGDPVQGFHKLPSDLPGNLKLTGFLSDDQYFGLLRTADAVMTLTTENHTMQRGACEAVWLGKPIIVSDWPLLRRSFHRGAVYVDNSVDGIRDGVIEMRQNHTRYGADVLLVQHQRSAQWKEIERELVALIMGATRVS